MEDLTCKYASKIVSKHDCKKITKSCSRNRQHSADTGSCRTSIFGLKKVQYLQLKFVILACAYALIFFEPLFVESTLLDCAFFYDHQASGNHPLIDRERNRRPSTDPYIYRAQQHLPCSRITGLVN